MATYAAKLRSEGIDGSTIRFNNMGEIVSNLGMQPFTSRGSGRNSVFYADGNVRVSGDGTSWEQAYKTLAEVLAAAHAYQGTSANRAWAQRATIYCCADSFDEDLTKFSEKTDVIGVGSTNQHNRCRVVGNHVLEAASTDSYAGCRFFNMEFYGQAAGILMDIPADQNGIEFHGCTFTAVHGGAPTSATIGLRATQAHDMTIKNCNFDPDSNGGFATAAIQINDGALTNFLLEGNRITSEGIGLDFNLTAGNTVNCWAIDNNLYCVGMPIDSEDNSTTSGLLVVGNRMITDVDSSTVTNGYDFSLSRSADNLLTGQNGPQTDEIPYRLQA